MAFGAVTLLSANLDAPRLLGLTSAGWGMVSITFALLHQIIVAVVFRLQLASQHDDAACLATVT